ncbi:MAG TPA: MCP four helix bundle domain-containing protein, partial [Thermoguttaceae bacterium]|nr:MCP four helix bundle domain-containing protein [Thermoguttaceae bacterium]
MEAVGKVKLPSVQALQTMQIGAERIKAAQRTLLNLGLSAEIRTRQRDNVAKARQMYEEAWKTYEALPKTAQEEELWKELVPAWQQWRADNNKFFQLLDELDALKLHNPEGFMKDLITFQRDHYSLIHKVNELVADGKKTESGEDHTQC